MSPQPDPVLLGIDIGGTKTALALADVTAGHRVSFVARHDFATPRTARGALAALLAAAHALVGQQALAGIGVSFGGQVRTRGTPRLKSLVIPGWEHIELAAELGRTFGDVPAQIANDGEAAARGEYVSMPPGERPNDLAYLTVSTGVGGAFLLNGRPHRGRHGLAAEVGHIPVRQDGQCPCGGIGHLEALASGPAIAQAAETGLAASPAITSVLRRLLGENGSLTAKDVDQAARRGDRYAAGVLSQAGALVGQAVALIALLLDPDAVIIGGGVAQAGDAFWLPLRSAARLGQLHDTPVLPARLGTDSALRGAADLARAAAMRRRMTAIPRASDSQVAEWH